MTKKRVPVHVLIWCSQNGLKMEALDNVQRETQNVGRRLPSAGSTSLQTTAYTGHLHIARVLHAHTHTCKTCRGWRKMQLLNLFKDMVFNTYMTWTSQEILISSTSGKKISVLNKPFSGFCSPQRTEKHRRPSHFCRTSCRSLHNTLLHRRTQQRILRIQPCVVLVSGNPH